MGGGDGGRFSVIMLLPSTALLRADRFATTADPPLSK